MKETNGLSFSITLERKTTSYMPHQFNCFSVKKSVLQILNKYTRELLTEYSCIFHHRAQQTIILVDSREKPEPRNRSGRIANIYIYP
jgi:hypothetical protein